MKSNVLQLKKDRRWKLGILKNILMFSGKMLNSKQVRSLLTGVCKQIALLMTCPKTMLPNADKPDWEIKVSEGLNEIQIYPSFWKM